MRTFSVTMAPSGDSAMPGWLRRSISADRQMEEQVENARRFAGSDRRDQPAERHGDLRSDAGEAGDWTEQGIEDFRPHGHRSGLWDS